MTSMPTTEITHPSWCARIRNVHGSRLAPAEGPYGPHSGDSFVLDAGETAAYRFTITPEQYYEMHDGAMLDSEPHLSLSIDNRELCEAFAVGRLSLTEARRLRELLTLAIQTLDRDA